MKIEDIAKICHDTNKSYCETIQDFSHAPWRLTPKHIQDSAIDGVKFKIANPDITLEESHENWLEFKKAQGYTYGEVKDDDRMTHPCMVEYDELPESQRVKDELFLAIVTTLKEHLDDESENTD